MTAAAGEPTGTRVLLRDLARVVGDEHVLAEPDLLAGYTTDWTRRYAGDALCAVRPGSAAEVAAVLRACAGHGATVVPQGGNTGLVGGSVPPGGRHGRGAVVLSARRLRELGPVDPLAAQVTAGAGATIADLRAHAAAAGLAYGVNLASRESATVGGTIATNAGGINTIRYGATRSQLLGIEAVLADGSIVSRLSGLAADNAGYDLTQLLAGSEGTLAVITAARLRLWPAEPAAVTLLTGVDGIAAAAALYAEIRAVAPGLRAAEYFEAAGVELVRELTGLRAPLSRRPRPTCWPRSRVPPTRPNRWRRCRRWPGRLSRWMRRAAARCGPTASVTPRRSARWASRTRWTWPCRSPGSPRSARNWTRR